MPSPKKPRLLAKLGKKSLIWLLAKLVGRGGIGLELADRSRGDHGHVDEFGLKPVHAVPQGVLSLRALERAERSSRCHAIDPTGVCSKAKGTQRGDDFQPALCADLRISQDFHCV